LDHLEVAAHSRSPIVRAVGNYELALLALGERQYLRARRRGYAALAALSSSDKRRPLELACDFLVSRALTGKSLSYSSEPVRMDWPNQSGVDPLIALEPDKLLAVLRENASAKDEVLLGPTVGPSPEPGDRWAVVCVRSPLEEVLQRFAEASNGSVRWKGISPRVRKRSLSLNCTAVSEQRFYEMAVGAAGLVADFGRDGVVIRNPDTIDDLKKQRELLSAEAIASWRRMMLRHPRDPAMVFGWFAMGLLAETSGDLPEALKNYTLLAERYRRHPMAPPALLRIARIHTHTGQFDDARESLLALIDRHPDYRGVDKAFQRLAAVEQKLKEHVKAMNHFARLYHRNLSATSRREAAFGAGENAYLAGEYDDAGRWMTRYLHLADKVDEPKWVGRAYYLLAMSDLRQGDRRNALLGMQRSIKTAGDEDQRLQSRLALAEIQIDGGYPVAAVGTLQDIAKDELGPDQLLDFLKINTRLLLSMGLPDKAAAHLREGMKQHSWNKEQQARMGLWLARCYIDSDESKRARKLLDESRTELQGAEAHEATCLLAELTLENDQPEMASTIVEGLLKSELQPKWKNKALNLLATSYVRQEKYQLAALTYAKIKESAQNSAEGK
ncbi:MAG: tetratricopeptide repeat protein, partial [Phycisphaerae bacterium]